MIWGVNIYLHDLNQRSTEHKFDEKHFGHENLNNLNKQDLMCSSHPCFCSFSAWDRFWPRNINNQARYKGGSGAATSHALGTSACSAPVLVNMSHPKRDSK